MTNEEKVNELLGLTSGEWLKLNEAGIYDNPNNTKGCLDAVYRSKLLEMADWKEEQLIQKAMEWLEKNFNMPNDFEQRFKRAMEK